MNFLRWLQESPLGSWVSTSDYGFYICLSGHAIGMAIVVGYTFALSARLLGFSTALPLSFFERLTGLAWSGFVLNLVTGLMLFAANGERLMRNTSFLFKIGFVAAAGIALWALWRAVRRQPGLSAGESAAAGQVRALAVVASIMWLLAVVSGRLIGYTLE